MHQENTQSFRNEPFLVMVTGNWAQHYSMEQMEYLDSLPISKPSLFNNQPSVPYDHIQRLNSRHLHNSELTADYHHLEFHSTMAKYDLDVLQQPIFAGAIPLLSDIVILPKVLPWAAWNTFKSKRSTWTPILRSFSRATKKLIRDSIFIVGRNRYKENTLDIVIRPSNSEN